MPCQYMGREADAAGPYYYRVRYYSPMMGGFISEDPIGSGGGQLSFYAGFRGDPLRFTDPYDLYDMDDFWGNVNLGLGQVGLSLTLELVKRSRQANNQAVIEQRSGTEIREVNDINQPFPKERHKERAYGIAG